jgi:xanthine phosphoribosyltransferase
MEKKYLRWEDIKTWSDCLSDAIAKDCADLSKATLLAVSRGGLIPAQLIAYKLNIRDVRVMKLISYDENNQRGDIKDISTDELVDGNFVYIIDDLADSGATVRYLRGKFPSAKVCVLMEKSCCTEKPDICALNGLAADTWLVFPWD